MDLILHHDGIATKLILLQKLENKEKSKFLEHLPIASLPSIGHFREARQTTSERYGQLSVRHHLL